MPMWLIWSSLAGGAVMFVWYAVAWMALPHHHGDFRSLGRSTPLRDAARSASPPPGLYMSPHYGDFPGGMKDPAFAAEQEKGPSFWMVVMRPGCGAGARPFLSAFGLNVLEAFVVAWILSGLSGVLGCLPCTVGVAVGLGAFARLGAYGALSVWMQLPRRYVLTTLFDAVVAFALAGLVIHAIH